MDQALIPPIRILPSLSTPLSSKQAQHKIAAFLEEYQARGGEGAVGVQLQKLVEAVKEERHKGKTDKKGTKMEVD